MPEDANLKQWYDWGLYDGREGLSKSRNQGFNRELKQAYDKGYERGQRIWERERRKTPA